MINIKFALLLFVVITIECSSIFLPALAQTNPKIQLAVDPPRPQPNPPPEGGDDSGTRSEFCENTKLSLKPLMPSTDRDVPGLTLKERPTFWFYVPYQNDIVSKGKFVLEDEEGKLEFKHDFKLPKTPGFVSFGMPITEKPLMLNKRYRWSFTLYCQSQNSSEPKSVTSEGWIQRVNMANLETQLRTAKTEERIKLYIQEQMWFDGASNFANNREFPQAWVKFLEAAGFADLKQELIGGEVVIIEKQ